jgi:hypothetical protein
VLRLDPSREPAWKRLGYRKVNGRWVTDEQLASLKAESEARKAADRTWRPRLEKWRRDLLSKTESKRAEAERLLAEISEPAAVRSIGEVFLGGDRLDARRAVQLLGQIDAVSSSRLLAHLAVFEADPEVRRAATETLRRRDPREFADVLIARICDPIKFKVNPVAGPGAPGELIVEGKKSTLKRTYASPPSPEVAMLPGDRVRLDENGLPVIDRSLGQGLVTDPVEFGRLALSPDDPFTRMIVYESMTRPIGPRTFFYSVVARSMTIPVGRMALESHRLAAASRRQLENDTDSIERHNDALREDNERIVGVLQQATGRDFGANQEAWLTWLTDQVGFALRSRNSTPEKPLIVEEVPIAYDAPPIAPTFIDKPLSYFRVSCFGAGTLVQTLKGPRPIETLKIGDRVLTQHPKTGALAYHPVTNVHHNPPSPTFLVKVAGDTIVSSTFHRFWVVGKGWVMARDLKGDETLRLLDGPSRVESISEGPVQPVFNLDVADSHNFFAGSVSALVHDNTLPDRRLRPFDAPAEIAAR